MDLDRESQAKLVEEIEQQWSADIDDEAYAEAARRMEASGFQPQPKVTENSYENLAFSHPLGV
jgi:hypothetical protein